MKRLIGPHYKAYTDKEDEIKPSKERLTDDESRIALCLYIAINEQSKHYIGNRIGFTDTGPIVLACINECVVSELCALLGGTSSIFSSVKDARSYPVNNYYLTLLGQKYLLEARMVFDCKVHFSIWKKLATALFNTIVYPDYIGVFEYEYRLWINERDCITVKIPHCTVPLADTYYVSMLKKYVGIPEHELSKDYNRSRYELRRKYFTEDHS